MTAAAAIALCTPLQPAQASQLTGDQLLRACEHSDDYRRGMCRGFVLGVGDLMRHLALEMPTMIDENGVDGRGYLTWCPFDTVIVNEVIDKVVAYLRDHPEDRDAPAYALVTITLGLNFPCP
jgi:hypothetical protein